MSTTPQAWLGSRQPDYKQPTRFSAAMMSLSSPQSAFSPQISTFGLYVALYGIVRQLGSLYQDVWLLATTGTLVQRFEQVLDTWRTCSERNADFHASVRHPSGVIAINALSLYRQTYVRLFADFGPLRSAFATRDVAAIVNSIRDTDITIPSSGMCLKAARCAMEAIQTSVKMGLFLTGPVSGWHRKLLFNLHSIECCTYSLTYSWRMNPSRLRRLETNTQTLKACFLVLGLGSSPDTESRIGLWRSKMLSKQPRKH